MKIYEGHIIASLTDSDLFDAIGLEGGFLRPGRLRAIHSVQAPFHII